MLLWVKSVAISSNHNCIVSNLEHVLNDILEHVDNVNTQITQIAAAVEEQSTASAEISNHMQSLTTSSQDVANIAATTNDIMMQTSQSITELHQLVLQFRLE